MDRDLQDDMIKLVQFSLVTTRREHERILIPLRSTLLRDSWTHDNFVAWVVTRYCRSREPWYYCAKAFEGLNVDHSEPPLLDPTIPRVFVEAVEEFLEEQGNSSAKERALAFPGWLRKWVTHFDKHWLDSRYLQVFYEVMDRWEKEPLYYEEKQLHVLRRIAKELDRPLAIKMADGPEEKPSKKK